MADSRWLSPAAFRFIWPGGLVNKEMSGEEGAFQPFIHLSETIEKINMPIPPAECRPVASRHWRRISGNARFHGRKRDFAGWDPRA